MMQQMKRQMKWWLEWLMMQPMKQQMKRWLEVVDAEDDAADEVVVGVPGFLGRYLDFIEERQQVEPGEPYYSTFLAFLKECPIGTVCTSGMFETVEMLRGCLVGYTEVHDDVEDLMDDSVEARLSSGYVPEVDIFGEEVANELEREEEEEEYVQDGCHNSPYDEEW